MEIFRKQGDDDDRRDDARRNARGSRGSQNMSPAGRPFRTMAFWVLVLLLAVVAYKMYSGNLLATQRVDIPYTRFVQEVEKGNIDKVTFAEEKIGRAHV